MSDSSEHELGDNPLEKTFFRNKSLLIELSPSIPPDVDTRVRQVIAEFYSALQEIGINKVTENSRSGIGEPRISLGSIDADVDAAVPACDDTLYLKRADLMCSHETLRNVIAGLLIKQRASKAAEEPIKPAQMAAYVAWHIFPVTTQHSIELARGSNNGEVFNVLDLQGRYAGITIIMPEDFRKTATVAILAMGITNPNKIIWKGLYSEFPKKAKAIQNEIAAIISKYKRSKA